MQETSRHLITRRASLAMGLAALVGPGVVRAATSPKQGGTLVFGGETEWGFLDPHVDTSGAMHRVNYQLYESLFWRDYSQPNNGKPPPIVPQLATGYDVSPDGTVYTIHLRQNVKFHDGTPFDAEAVDFNVRRVWDKSFQYYYPRAGAGSLNATVWKELDEIQVVDEHTIRFVRKKPWVFFIEQLAEPTGGGLPVFISPAAVKKWGNTDVEQHPTGTGPFRFVEHVRGQRIVFERNPDYWRPDLPYLDRIIWRPLPEAATRVNALLAGEVDIVASVPPDSVEQIKNAGLDVAMGATPHVWWLNFNHDEAPFSNVKVRQAISHAINKEAMAKQLLRGTVLPAISMVSRTSPSYDGTWKEAYPYDPERAKALLSEAGYANGFATTMLTSTAGSGQIMPVQMAEWIQRDLAKVGVKLNLQTFEWNTYVGMWVKGLKPGMGINQMSWGTNCDFWLNYVLAPGVNTNSGHINDPQITEMLDSYIRIGDTDKRIAAAREIHARERAEAHNLPIINDLAPFGMSSKVKGFIRAADWMEDYKLVWKEA